VSLAAIDYINAMQVRLWCRALINRWWQVRSALGCDVVQKINLQEICRKKFFSGVDRKAPKIDS
jgi:hypothetical protein